MSLPASCQSFISTMNFSAARALPSSPLPPCSFRQLDLLQPRHGCSSVSPVSLKGS